MSDAVAARATAGPPTLAPATGAVTLPVGCVRSTRTVRGALVVDVAAAVGRDGDQLPLLLGGGRGRPGGGERRGRVGADRGARAAAADGAVAEGDVGRVGRGGRGQVDARADGGTRVVERDDRRVVVDVDRAQRGRRLVAGDVGDDDPELGGPVRRAPSSRASAGRSSRTTGAVWVPKTLYAPAPAGLTSKRTAETPDAGGTAPSRRVRVDRDRAGDEGAAGGRRDRAGRRGVVDRLRQAGKELVGDVAGRVGDDGAQVVGAVGDERRVPGRLVRRRDVGARRRSTRRRRRRARTGTAPS